MRAKGRFGPRLRRRSHTYNFHVVIAIIFIVMTLLLLYPTLWLQEHGWPIFWARLP